MKTVTRPISKQSKTNYILPVEYNEEGEAFLTFPEALMKDAGWSAGDELTWRKIRGKNAYTLTKKK